MSQNNSDRAPPGGQTIQLPTSLTSDAGDGVADALDLLYRTTRNWRFGYLADFERRVAEGGAGPRALPDDGSLREVEELIKTGQERGPTAAARRVVRKYCDPDSPAGVQMIECLRKKFAGKGVSWRRRQAVIP